MQDTDWGSFSLLPLIVTLILAFVTRSALIAMLVGVVVGSLMVSVIPAVGLNELFQFSLGNANFIWICEIVMLLGVFFELVRRSNALATLSEKFHSTQAGRRRVEISAWAMGIAIVDDYFSPLMTGAIVRPMSDRVLIPREKLAFILDATTSSVCIIVPFTAWGAYFSGLLAAQAGPIDSTEAGLGVFIEAIAYNYYPLIMIVFTLFIAAGIMPDFGAMRSAERRVKETGQLIRPGSKPLQLSDDHSVAGEPGSKPPLLVLELLMPIILLVAIGVWSLITMGSVKIVEAFMVADCWLIVVHFTRGRFESVAEIGEVIGTGVKNVMPALLIIALAYTLNAVTTQLGASRVLVELFEDVLQPGYLVVFTFLITALISFATGTSWGSYALMVPVTLPLAFELTGGQLDVVVYQTVAAIAGGGIFGDHASPVSDTTVLSSAGAGSDHIDHVLTQMPYALSVAAVTTLIYIVQAF